MAQTKNPVLKQTFNIFNTGRKYTGIQRGYLLDNAKKVIYDPITRERLRLRQLYGYMSHTYRELAGKLSLPGKTPLTLKDGRQIIADTEPNSVCIDLDIDDAGNVTHSQEVFVNTDGGKGIIAMNENKVGGWSWACAPGGVTSSGNTLISSIHGFDYDPNPLFVNNKAWVMDSDHDAVGREQLLKALRSHGVEKPGLLLDSWYASAVFVAEKLQGQIVDAEIMLLDANQENESLQQVNDSLTSRVETLETLVTERQQSYESELQQINDSHTAVLAELQQSNERQRKADEEKRKAVLEAFGNQSAVSIPSAVLDALASPDSVNAMQPVQDFLQQVAKIPGGLLPLGQGRKAEYVKKRGFGKDDDNLGTIGVIPDMAF